MLSINPYKSHLTARWLRRLLLCLSAVYSISIPFSTIRETQNSKQRQRQTGWNESASPFLAAIFMSNPLCKVQPWTVRSVHDDVDVHQLTSADILGGVAFNPTLNRGKFRHFQWTSQMFFSPIFFFPSLSTSSRVYRKTSDFITVSSSERYSTGLACLAAALGHHYYTRYKYTLYRVGRCSVQAYRGLNTGWPSGYVLS
jgi:hypothetical protein